MNRPSESDWSAARFLRSVASWVWGAVIGVVGMLAMAMGQINASIDSRVHDSEQRIMGYLEGRREVRNAEMEDLRHEVAAIREDTRLIKEILLKKR